MLPVLLLLFVAVPIIELAAIIQVGSLIGLWPTLAILVADSILGGVLLRSQGRAAWRSFSSTLGSGRLPAREVLDGALVIFGGALLLTPGFVTDVFGLLCLIPPTRAIMRRVLVRRFAHRMVASAAASRPFARSRSQPADFDVEGTATDVSRDPRRLP